MERVKTLLWVMKLQFNSARLAFVLNSIYYLYDGLVSIVFAYISAKLITSVTEVALQGAEPNSVYIWFISLFGLSILTNILGSINRVVESRIEQKVEITTSEIYFKKMYSLSQEQFDDETFNVKLARGREGLMDLNRVTRELNWTMSSFVRFISAIIAITVVAPILGLIVTIVAIPVAAVGIKQNKIREKM
jgi:ABC-type transport system involved in cytochrome bd biosynthesis fused ATPase/permease subunit